jgi:prephenate dehydrogenase
MPTDPPLGRLAVLGLGIMGGSLARAVSSLGLAKAVTGWSPEATERDAALTAGAVSAAPATWREAISGADLVVLAAPLQGCLALLAALPEGLEPDATVTDVTSLKLPVAEAARAAGLEDRWIGSHPMTGSESSGFWASRAELYEGATVWITSADGSQARGAHRQVVERLWASLGGRPRSIGAAEHDRLMALASHLPQLASNALARTLERSDIDPSALGPGGRDMTRLASSSPEMWTDLLRHADPAVVEGLRSLAREADALADLVESGAIEQIGRIMHDTRAWRSGS